jgi:hypothetical protein
VDSSCCQTCSAVALCGVPLEGSLSRWLMMVVARKVLALAPVLLRKLR